MDFFLKWLFFASVNVAATMSPGPAFALTVRNAMVYNRKAGVLASIGLGFGAGVHIVLVLGGISVLLAQSALFYNIVKYAGAAYLIFIGFKAVQSKKKTADLATRAEAPAPQDISAFKALRMGFLTNMLNPKAMVYFTAVFTQFLSPEMPLTTLIVYGLTSFFIEILWFAILSLFLTDERVREKFAAISHWIERACGGLLVLLGVRLALSKIH